MSSKSQLHRFTCWQGTFSLALAAIRATRFAGSYVSGTPGWPRDREKERTPETSRIQKIRWLVVSISCIPTHTMVQNMKVNWDLHHGPKIKTFLQTQKPEWFWNAEEYNETFWSSGTVRKKHWGGGVSRILNSQPKLGVSNSWPFWPMRFSQRFSRIHPMHRWPQHLPRRLSDTNRKSLVESRLGHRSNRSLTASCLKRTWDPRSPGRCSCVKELWSTKAVSNWYQYSSAARPLKNVKTWSLHSFFFQVLLLLPCGKSNCAWTALGSCNPWQMQQNATNSSFSRPLASCKAACPSKACVLARLERESPQDHLLTRPDDDSTKLTKHTSYHNYVWHQHLSTIINHHNYPVSEPIVPQSWIWWNVGQRLWQAFSQLLVQLHHLAIQKLSNDLHQLIGTLCVAVLFVPGAGCVSWGGSKHRTCWRYNEDTVWKKYRNTSHIEW